MGELHDQLVARAGRWLRNTRGCAVVAREPVAFACSEYPDAIGWTARGSSILVECKVSIEDYKRDKHKPSERSGNRMGLERWYLTPAGLLKDVTLPEGWGLLELRSGDRVYRVREAATINARDNLSEMAMLVAITRRALGGFANGVSISDGTIETNEATQEAANG